jgi:hypothetical protein
MPEIDDHHVRHTHHFLDRLLLLPGLRVAEQSSSHADDKLTLACLEHLVIPCIFSLASWNSPFALTLDGDEDAALKLVPDTSFEIAK